MSSRIYDEIQADVKIAMKARETDKLTALRMLMARIKDATVNAGKEITDGEVVKIVARAIKQRQDSVEQFRTGDRNDLADKEQAEIDLFKKYQPEQMSEGDIEALVKNVISAVGAEGKSDMGKVMKELMPQVQGKADGKLVSQTVARLLG